MPNLLTRIAALALLTLSTGSLAQLAPETPDIRRNRAAAHLTFQQLVEDTLGPPQWRSTGDRFVYWAETGAVSGTWMEVDAASGTARPLIAPQALAAQLRQAAGNEVAALKNPPFVLAPDERAIYFRAGKQAFSLYPSSGKVVQLAASDLRALRLSPAHAIAPDDHAIASSNDGGLTLLDTRAQVRISRPAATDRYWELPQQPWSPDNHYLLAWQVDQRAMHKLPLVDYSAVIETSSTTRYSKVGTPLARQALFAIERSSGRLMRLALPTDEGYMSLAGWRGGARALVLHLSRDGKRLRLFEVDPRGAPARLVLTEERAASFVGDLNFVTEGWQYQVTPLADGQSFLWMSERDGYRHAYLYGYDGRLQRQVTKGNFPIKRIAALAPDSSVAYAIGASEQAPYDELLYAARLDGSSMTRLSERAGVHKISIGPGGRYYTDGYSDLAHPRRWAVAAVSGGPGVVYSSADASKIGSIGYHPPEPVRVMAADGVTELHGRLYKPAEFDPQRRYGVIDVIYGAPFTSLVPNSFNGTSMGNLASALAQMGFVTLVLDARGAPGRSKAFHDTHYGKIGQGEIGEHVSALRQLAATRPYMDLARAGIHGHSWGGYFALRGMLTAPDFFKAGYAGAPGALEEDAVINEPNLGLRSANPEGYRRGANEPLAGQLRGTLRIMHGSADVNAPLGSTMRMIDAFIKAGKHIELLIMPGQGHTPEGPEGRYYFDDISMFFERALGPPTAVTPGSALNR
jgi:dipeptidyl aminopeptidase/acylaminoacyl peptidase